MVLTDRCAPLIIEIKCRMMIHALTWPMPDNDVLALFVKRFFCSLIEVFKPLRHRWSLPLYA